MRARWLSRDRPAVVTFMAAWMMLFALSAAWAIATPMAGTPDEPSHIIKAAAVVRGELVGEPTELPAWTRVDVPSSVSSAQGWARCFEGKPDTPASCAPSFGSGRQLASAETSAGLYNPTYYALVGWPSLVFDGARQVVVGMRLTSALLVSGLLAVTLMALRSFGRPRLATIGLFAAATPMTFFLAGSVNPNAVEIAGVAAALAILAAMTLRAREAPVPRRALVLLAIAASLAANARAISPLWLGLIVVIVIATTPPRVLLALFRQVRVWATAVVVMLATAAAALWTVSTSTLSHMGTFAGAGTVGPARGFFEMLLDRSFDPGLVAYFGHLDTLAPSFVYVVWSALALSVAGAGLAFLRGRERWALIVLIGVFLLVPPLVQAASVTNSGYIWQGRYTLVAYVAVLVYATAALASRAPRHTWSIDPSAETRLFWIVTSLVAIGHGWSIAQMLRRYAAGVSFDWIDVLRSPAWLPTLGIPVWPALTVVAVVGFAWLGSARSSRADDHASCLRTEVR